MIVWDTLRQLKKAETENGSSEAVVQMKHAVQRQIALVCGAVLLIMVLIFAMSVAWYTNVSQTGGLTFETESWGFDQNKIKISKTDETYAVAPGASGLVPLTVDNTDSADAIRAVVNIKKTDIMDTELQKRIFFYADTPKTYVFASKENGDAEDRSETVPRVWLGTDSIESYPYEIQGGEKLTLTQEFSSDVPIRWMWVYDMEGYYFRGTVKDDQVTVDEYLRPLEYDLDQAVFDETEGSATSGQLLRIGTQSRMDFLKEIFDADGYDGSLKLKDGEVDASQITKAGGKVYYKVAVGDDGSGIWAYLNTWEEIQKGLEYDNALSKKDTPVQVTATVQVTVQNVAAQKVEAADTEQLKALLESGTDQVISLTGDMAVAEPLELSADQNARIDLNGYTLSYGGSADAYCAFVVPEGADLTLLNGTLSSNGKVSSNAANISSIAVEARGGNLIMSGIKVSGFDTAVSVDDRDAESDSVVKISGCDFDTNSSAVSVFGNGSKSEARSRMIIEDSKIKSGYIGITGQGTNKKGDERWGTSLTLIHDEIEGYWAALYQPQQQSDTVMKNCTLKGYTGMAVKGGSVTAYSCFFEGTGEHGGARNSGGDWNDTGDGVYVEATYGWSATVLLRGRDNIVKSHHSYAVELFGEEGKGPGKLVTEGGTYNGEQGTSNWNEIGSFSVETN